MMVQLVTHEQEAQRGASGPWPSQMASQVASEDSVSSSWRLGRARYHFTTWNRAGLPSGETDAFWVPGAHPPPGPSLALIRARSAMSLPCRVRAGKGFLRQMHLCFCSEVRAWCYDWEGRIAFWAKLDYAARYNFIYLYSYFPYPLFSKALCPCSIK